jgi:polyketide biosynthesis acyl carrier protein
MTKEQIFKIIKESVIEVLPDINDEDIKIEGSLKELGANSIDRLDITVMCMEALQIKVPMMEFGRVKNIQGLVDLLYEKNVTLE